MSIRVSFDNYESEQLQAVCDCYNSDKPDDWERLEILDRMEGCFKIRRNKLEEDLVQRLENNKFVDENELYKQVRWNKKYLVTPMGYYSFSNFELHHLYLCMIHVFGENMVFYEEHGKH